MKVSSHLLSKLRAELVKVADRKKAPQMQAYMKSQMPYHGVPAPLLKKTCKAFFEKVELPSFEVWKEHLLFLWRDAKFREERYAALLLSGDRRAKPFQTMKAIEIYEEMIVSGAWWDYVDPIASHRVGTILSLYPAPMTKLMLGWARSPDIWIRRTSILCQLGAKDKTDLDLLYRCIEPSLGSSEFFLRKAIGWALRQVAWRNPKEVIRYVKQNSDRLSSLSKREALKNLIKSGAIKRVP